MRWLTLSLAMASPAFAQPQCAPYEAVAVGLYRNYGEELASRGLSAGMILETWANVETGTWTIIAVGPDLVACLVTSGDGFEAHSPRPNL